MEEELREYEVLEKIRGIRGWAEDDPEYKKRQQHIAKKYMAIAREAARPTAGTGGKAKVSGERKPRAQFVWGKGKKGLFEQHLKGVKEWNDKKVWEAVKKKVGGTEFKPDRTSPAGKLRGNDWRRYICNVEVGNLYVRLIRDDSGITVQEGEAAGGDEEEEEDEEEGEEEHEPEEENDDDAPPPPKAKAKEPATSAGAGSSKRGARERIPTAKAAAPEEAVKEEPKKRSRRAT